MALSTAAKVELNITPQSKKQNTYFPFSLVFLLSFSNASDNCYFLSSVSGTYGPQEIWKYAKQKGKKGHCYSSR